MMEFMDEALLLSEIRKDNEDAFAFLFKKSFPRLPPAWYPVHRSWGPGLWPVLRLVPQARRLQ